MADSEITMTNKPKKSTQKPPYSRQMLIIGLNITKYRKNLNLKKKDLAKLLGVAASTVRRYELGIYNIPIARMTDIANVLGVSITDLMSEPADFDETEIKESTEN